MSASAINGVSYLWSDGQTLPSISVANPGIYYITVTDAISGCLTTSAPVSVNNSVPNIPICLVTVDDFSTHNVVVWEKPITAEIDSFRIYREVMTNVYSHIGSVAYDSLSEYDDYGADPNTTSFKYKIAVLDTCGGNSTLSNFHSTIHLQYLSNGNLQWTVYDIENAANPVTYYQVSRDDIGGTNFVPVSSTIPGGNTTWTDVNYALYPNANYVVDVIWGNTCTSSRSIINTTRSNIKHTGSISVGINTSGISADDLLVYPNPANEKITVLTKYKMESIKLFNLMGEVVYQSEINSSSQEVDISHFAKGIYTIEIKIKGNTIFKKLVIN